jgi:hypothetical protein
MDETPAGVVAQIKGHKPSATAEKHYWCGSTCCAWHSKTRRDAEQAGMAQPTEHTPALRAMPLD